MAAAHAGSREAVALLLDAGANTKATNHGGQTALHLNANEESNMGPDHVAIATLLIQAGADVNAVDNDGVTVLMSAAVAGIKELVDLLLERGVDPKAIDSKGMAAAEGGNTGVVERMIEIGQNVQVVEEKQWPREHAWPVPSRDAKAIQWDAKIAMFCVGGEIRGEDKNVVKERIMVRRLSVGHPDGLVAQGPSGRTRVLDALMRSPEACPNSERVFCRRPRSRG